MGCGAYDHMMENNEPRTRTVYVSNKTDKDEEFENTALIDKLKEQVKELEITINVLTNLGKPG